MSFVTPKKVVLQLDDGVNEAATLPEVVPTVCLLSCLCLSGGLTAAHLHFAHDNGRVAQRGGPEDA